MLLNLNPLLEEVSAKEWKVQNLNFEIVTPIKINKKKFYKQIVYRTLFAWEKANNFIWKLKIKRKNTNPVLNYEVGVYTQKE